MDCNAAIYKILEYKLLNNSHKIKLSENRVQSFLNSKIPFFKMT